MGVLFGTLNEPLQSSKIESSPLTEEEFELLRELKQIEQDEAFYEASKKFGW